MQFLSMMLLCITGYIGVLAARASGILRPSERRTHYTMANKTLRIFKINLFLMRVKGI